MSLKSCVLCEGGSSSFVIVIVDDQWLRNCEHGRFDRYNRVDSPKGDYSGAYYKFDYQQKVE